MSTALPKEELRALFATLSGMPASRVIWDGEPKGWAGKTTSGKTGHLVLDLLATRSIGVDEETREYNVMIDGTLATRVTYSGQRVRTVSVRAEAYDAEEGFDILEDLRIKLSQDDTCELLNAAGLAFNSTEDVVPLDVSAGNRAVTFASMDVRFNQMVTRVVTNTTDAYIDTIELSGSPDLQAITSFTVSSGEDLDFEMSFANLFFGDGSDGDITVTTPVTLTRDMFYRNLTLAAGASINTAGYKVFVQQKLNLVNAPANAIVNNGIDGPNGSVVPGTTNSVIPASYVSGTWSSILNSPGYGGAGGTTSAAVGGATGSATGLYLGGAAPGTLGGNGGSGSASVGAAPGVWTPSTRTQNRLRYPTVFASGFANSAVSVGGGGGGGDNTAGAGNQGGNGGCGAYGGGGIFIAARQIERASTNPNAGIICAKGGKGGNGSAPTGGNRGGGGGAMGAAGGSIYILCAELLGSEHANALDVSGGAGGAGGAGTGTGTAGQGGQAGFGGLVYLLNVASGITVYDATAAGGNSFSGANGGASTPAQLPL